MHEMSKLFSEKKNRIKTISLSSTELAQCVRFILIVFGYNDTSTPVGHFVSSLGEREKRVTSQKHAYIILTPLNPTFI